MPVGLFISIAARDAISHGETSSVAKLAFESTILPLLKVGCWMSAGFWEVRLDCFGLMRDTIEGADSGGSFATESSDSIPGSEDSRRLFLEMLLFLAS